MSKYYHADAWKLETGEIFESSETMVSYVTDNWEEYANPIGDEKKLVGVEYEDGLVIDYATMDYEEDGSPGEWVYDEVELSVKLVEYTQKVDF
jgi:hypothetical protein